jgi:type IV pilus assembly protein PilY1
MKDGYFYVDSDSDPFTAPIASYVIKVDKDVANEPQDFHQGNLAGIMQRVGDKARWGNEWFYEGTGANEEGGFIANRLGGNMTNMVTTIENQTCDTWTPLAEAYLVAMHHFKQEALPAGLGFKSGGILPINDTNDPYHNGSEFVPCAKSFVILLTDGASTKDNKIPDYLKDYDNDGNDPGAFSDNGSDYLDDIALYAHTNDLRPAGAKELEGMQNLTLYTIYAFGSDSNARQLLRDAARNGAFIDKNNNNVPDGDYASPPEDREEWDANGDGDPDTFFEASDGYELERKLLQAINDILKRTASGTAVSVLATTGEGEGTIVQAFFKPVVSTAFEDIKWVGFLQSLWVDTKGNIREDTDGDKGLDVDVDRVLSFYLDTATGETKVKRYDVSTDPYPDTDTATPVYILLEEINPIWEAGSKLAQRPHTDRNIFTFADIDADGTVDSPGELLEFTTANAAELQPFFGVADDATWGTYWGLGTTQADRTNNIISFIRGVPDGSADYTGNPTIRRRTLNGNLWKLGDIVYSTPLSLSKPVENFGLLYDDASYRNFYQKYRNRETIVYVGANDGMLHAFTSGVYNQTLKKFEPLAGTPEQIGDELWAYIPQCLLPHLKWLSSENYTHVPFVDLKPKVVDAKIFTADPDISAGALHPNGWGTILLCGMNMGAKEITATGFRTFYPSYVAIDVTDPRQPRLLWEKTFAGLGLTTCIPSVVKVEDEWYAVLGSGPTEFDGTSNQNARIFIVDLLTGNLLHDPAFFEASQTSSFANSPVGLDKSINYNVDAIYAGVTYPQGGTPKGKAYKIAIPQTDNGLITGNYDAVASYNPDPTSWKMTALFDGPAPLTAPFSISMDRLDNVWVYFGSGRYIADVDKTSNQQQYIFGIKDPFFNPDRAGIGYHDYNGVELGVGDLFDADPITINADGSVSGLGAGPDFDADLVFTARQDDGWIKSLLATAPSERVINKPAVLGGIVLVPAFTPNTNICGFGGSSNLYAIYFETGTAYKKKVVGTDAENSPTILDVLSLGEGLSSSFGIHVGKQDGGTIFGQQSTGVIVDVDVLPAIKVKSGSVYWREGQ